MSGVPGPLQGVLARVLGLHRLERLYSRIQSPGAESISEKLLHQLAVTYRASDADLKQIPRSGATVIVANHPFGILEGAVLAALLRRIRPDVRILANRLLAAVPELEELVIPVEVLRANARANAGGLRKCVEFLRSGGCLAVFPAGEVSHFRPCKGVVEDSEWHSFVARLIESVSRSGQPVTVVPVYIHGSNSALFQLAGLLHRRLRTALLVHELLNKRNTVVDLRIGSPITHNKLLEIPTPEERTEYLRWRTYLLSHRQTFKAQTSVPLNARRGRGLPRENVIAPVPAQVLAAEIGALPQDHWLFQTGDLEVYLASASQMPSVLQEIGRLREITFRAAGEGTGQAIDLDRFDAAYLHLFVWNAAKKEIAGAYRFAGADTIRELYTSTLFRYKSEFLDRLGPALELGRSFVRQEYQRGFAPLLALWRGIGSHVARNPRYKTLFGPVSISNQYQAVSRELMVAFLERRAPLREWAHLIASRNPLQRRTHVPEIRGLNIDDLSECIADLEPSRAGVPVLLRQYLKLGGRLLGFNVDPNFSDALDGLIVVDLTKTEPRLLDRYLGKAEAQAFLEYQQHQKGTYAP